MLTRLKQRDGYLVADNLPSVLLLFGDEMREFVRRVPLALPVLLFRNTSGLCLSLPTLYQLAGNLSRSNMSLLLLCEDLR